MKRKNIFKEKARETFSEIQGRCRKGLEENRERKMGDKARGGSNEKGQVVKEGHRGRKRKHF